jgi:predicted DNA-binding protein with PD1-like motif
VIFDKGDEVASGLMEFAEKYHVTGAHFTAIGALHDATIGWMDRDKKAYKAIPINTQVEVLTMAGDIAEYQGKPAVHAHLVVGMDDGSAKGGHLLEAHVYPTLEVMVTVDPVAMMKRFDPETGLVLIDPGRASAK